jgi:transketolase
MDVYSLREISRIRPNQLINVGVAEQNTLNVAAGLAASGCKVLVFGISSFFAFRSYEQLRINIAGMGLPVTVVGVGQGFSFSYDGPTHHGIDDLAVLRTIPELEILNPGDSEMARACAVYVGQSFGPKYVRLDKGKYPSLYPLDAELGEGFNVLHDISAVTIVATGSLLPMAKEAVGALQRLGITVGLIDVVRISPLPNGIINRLGGCEKVIVVEENSSVGGLYSSILEASATRTFGVSYLGNGLFRGQIFNYGSRGWHKEKAGLTLEALVEKVKQDYASTRDH